MKIEYVPSTLCVMPLSLVKLQINVVSVVPCIKTKGSQLTSKIWIPLSICTKLLSCHGTSQIDTCSNNELLLQMGPPQSECHEN